jgi:hypothetical protein
MEKALLNACLTYCQLVPLKQKKCGQQPLQLTQRHQIKRKARPLQRQKIPAVLQITHQTS